MRTPVRVEIDGLTEDGDGTGVDARGRRWVARGAVPGSVVFMGRKPKNGLVLSVETPHADAIAAPCTAFGLCGGCQWQTWPLSRQREEKLRALQTLFAPFQGECLGIVGPEAGYGWRNKMEFGYGVERFLSAVEMADKADRHGQFLGLHAPGRFDRVVDLTECALMSPQMQVVYARIRADTMASGWSAWNPHGGTGFWRHLALREGAEGLVVSLHTAPPDAEQLAWLIAHAPQWGASGVRLIAGADASDVVKGEVSMLWGTPFLVEYLGPVRYTLHADAFFQVNREGAALLCAQIAALAGRGEALLDLYCGTGAIGLFLAATGHFSQVIGVEIIPEAVETAIETARQNNLSVEFHCGAVEAVVPTLAFPASPTIIVDPPRSGLHPKALAFLSQQAAEALIYVACRPSSLARDGAVLAAAGWVLDRWVAVDMFPQTRHIEVVSRWVRPTPTSASPEMP